MSNHTPLPWQISDARTVDDTPMIVGGEGFEFGLIADVTEDYDAVFIVTAVNERPALQRRIQELEAALRFYADPFTWKKLHDPDDDIRVPDFYSETSFGDTAIAALSTKDDV